MSEPIEIVAQAKTLDEVVSGVCQYLSRWSPESLALIPRRCRPHWIGSVEDVDLYAHQLQLECARRDACGTPISNEMELMRDFFAGAAGIAALIRMKDADKESDSWPHPGERVRWRSPL